MAVLVGLYEEPEKPANALEYAPTPALGWSRGATAPTEEPPWSCAHGSFIKMTLGAPTGVDVEALKVRHDPSLAGSWPVAHVGEHALSPPPSDPICSGREREPAQEVRRDDVEAGRGQQEGLTPLHPASFLPPTARAAVLSV